jgi:hypothetical protein
VPRPAALPAARPDAPRAADPAAAACLAQETARYRVTFGILGKVAEAELSVTPDSASWPAGAIARPSSVRAVGVGDGDVLGFGKTHKRIESEFEVRTLRARRWSNVRSSDGKTTADTAEQAQPGSVALLRKRTGEADLTESFQRTAPVLDPLSFLLRLRLAPPATPTVYEVLDGRALWLAEVSAMRAEASGLLRMDGKLTPIYWSGGPDRERGTYTFSLFFAPDRFRTPVRLVVPYGLGEARADLIRVERRTGGRGRVAGGEPACDEPRGRHFWRGIAAGWADLARSLPARGRARP